MRARVELDSQHHVGTIDERIFGGFLEHLGRAVYDGIYDPGNALSDDQGFRLDVLEALRALRMPLVRYPGGNFVSSYDWTDGIGPRDLRPVRPDFAWQSLETNQFGTDEFMAWCAALGTAPMLAVNLGTGGAAGAKALVKYCNFPGGSAWSDRRRANGHAAPYGVKLWCLGNEMDGPWQAGHVPVAVYAHRADQARAMIHWKPRCPTRGRLAATIDEAATQSEATDLGSQVNSSPLRTDLERRSSGGRGQ
jgi:alpha-N-arabinofuranosidase